MAAPVSTAGNPLGANGFQLEVSTARAAPITKIRMAAILMITITLFVLALSFTPFTRIQVRTIRTRNAEILNQFPVSSSPLIGGLGGDRGLRQEHSRLRHGARQAQPALGIRLRRDNPSRHPSPDWEGMRHRLGFRGRRPAQRG